MIRCLAMLLLVLSVFAGGCAPSSQAPGPPIATPVMPPDGAPALWPYWPASMRVHPLSRIVRDAKTGATVIEARIEFRDRDGFTTRCSGLIRIDLADQDGVIAVPWPKRPEEMDLRNPFVNRERFDDITRTYLFPLEVGAEQLPAVPIIWVYFESADGREFTPQKFNLRVK